MSYINNKHGIALVTSLMFTFLALVISMALLYMVTAGVRTSGAIKRYKTVVDATYGGTDLLTKDILTTTFGFNDYSSSHPGTSFSSFMSTSMNALSDASFSGCLRQRLTTPSRLWSTACSNVSLNPKVATDVSFTLNASTGSPYAVYAKIVDTMERKFLVLDAGVQKSVVIAGNTDSSSFVLDGGSTTSAGGVTVPHYPFVYRLEIQGERQQNPVEKSNISVLYAY